MQLKTLFTCASFVAATFAQQARIAFSVIPTTIQAGQPTTLQWGGGNGSPVTLTLQQGPSDDLKTVSTIATNAMGNSFTFTPSSSLPDGQNYAIRIDQQGQDPNYTGQITLTGGSSSSSSATASAISSITGSSVVTAPSTSATIAAAPSTGIPPSSANATTTAAGPVGTGVVGTGVVGTGAAGASGSAASGTGLLRNTTFSSATLSSSAPATSTVSATSSSNGGSDSGSAPAPSSSDSGSGAALTAASNFALLAAAVVGVVYLG